MANTLITSSMITKYAMAEFKNAMVLLSKVDRQLDKSGAFDQKVGDTINIRKRVRLSAISGPDITGSIEDAVEGSIPLVLNTQKTVPLSFTAKELALDIEDFNERYIRPAAIELVQQVESALAALYTKVWWFTGTPGTTPATFLSVGAAKAILDNAGVPSDSRSGFYEPTAAMTLANGMSAVFPQKVAQTAIEEAMINRYSGFDLYTCQSIVRHTVGPLGGTPLVNGASQNVTYLASKDGYSQSLITDGWTAAAASRVKAGDVITIAGVNSVNPRTRQDTGSLQTFTILADGSSDGSGNLTLTISPPIITSGSYQTVTAAPADNAAITVKTGTASTSYPQNLLFHKDAFTVAFGRLAPLDGAVTSRVEMDGVSLTYTSQGNALTGQNVRRLDVLFGVVAQNPGMAVRHTG